MAKLRKKFCSLQTFCRWVGNLGCKQTNKQKNGEKMKRDTKRRKQKLAYIKN